MGSFFVSVGLCRLSFGLRYGRGKHVPVDAPRPLPTAHWHRDNIELLERYEQWLWGGGVSELVIRTYHVPMAGHVFGLTLKHHAQLDLVRLTHERDYTFQEDKVGCMCRLPFSKNTPGPRTGVFFIACLETISKHFEGI